jgi:hypothetical protein
MTERTETVEVFIPVPPYVVDDSEITNGLAGRADEALGLELAERGTRPTAGEPLWDWRKMDRAEVSERLPQYSDLDATFWSCTATVSVEAIPEPVAD